MPEQQDNQNLPAVADEKKKSGILKWVLLIAGSFAVSYAISLIWIIYVEKPQEQVQSSDDIIAQDSTIVAEELAENIPDTNEEITEDTINTNSIPAGNEQTETVREPAVTEPTEQAESTKVVPAAEEPSYTANQTSGNIPKANASPQQELEDQQDFKKLAKIYSQMEAKAAAQILGRMDDEMVVGILNEMRDRNAAELLTAFSSIRAARLSQELSKLGT